MTETKDWSEFEVPGIVEIQQKLQFYPQAIEQAEKAELEAWVGVEDKKRALSIAEANEGLKIKAADPKATGPIIAAMQTQMTIQEQISLLQAIKLYKEKGILKNLKQNEYDSIKKMSNITEAKVRMGLE